jgi:hypothetical protein
VSVLTFSFNSSWSLPMRNVDVSLVSGWAGAALIAVPALELLLDVAAAADAGR